MSRSHIKRLVMPRSWPLPRKSSIWVQKPNPGGHSIEHCMPLALVLRDVIGVAHTRREAKRILRDLQRRVRGLATLHRSLYTGPETTTIDAAELIRTMLNDLAPASPDVALTIDTRLDEVHLFPDQAVPLSMLFSEAMTNAIKYAGRPEDGPARISVVLEARENGVIFFCLENTLGQRLMPEADFDNEVGGLGTRLMRAFISQLEGRAEQDQDERTYRYMVTFKRADFTGDAAA